MTPFERAKIKDCFTELLRGMQKRERRAYSIESSSILNSDDQENRGGDFIDELTGCLTSKTMQ